MTGYVYILASRRNGTLYTGVTADISRRIWEHKDGSGSAFALKYGVNRLVWYRHYFDIRDAIADEKRIKRWRRDWKIAAIEDMNPDWNDLYREIGL